MNPYLDDGDVILYQGDSLDLLADLKPESIDAVVTDPPYGMSDLRTEYVAEALTAWVAGEEWRPRGAGFMGHAWDAFVPGPELWRECLRVLKPGGHLLAFSAPRTVDLMGVAIRLAGFEIRDEILAYMFGQGFPKSLNPGCRCEREPRPEHDVRGVPEPHVPPPVGAAPGQGPVLLKVVQEQGQPPNGSAAGHGDVRANEPRLEGRGHVEAGEGELRRGEARPLSGVGASDGPFGRVHRGAPLGHGEDGRTVARPGGGGAPQGPRPVEQRPVELGALADQRIAQAGRGWPTCDRCGLPMGTGTALKPCHEPILVARKPIARTVAATLAAHGTGVLNIDGCRIGIGGGTSGAQAGPQGAVYGEGLNGARGEPVPGLGRWPGNVALVHGPGCREVGERTVAGDARIGGDGRREGGFGDVGAPAGDGAPNGRLYGDDDGLERVTAWECQPGCPVAALDAQAPRAGGQAPASGPTPTAATAATVAYGARGGMGDRPPAFHGDTGSASRFFYTAKASTAERDGSKHPTVKPLALMRWLCRLVTPPGGLILDPFAGSGTTLLAARREGFRAIGMEREDQWCADIAHRLRELSLLGAA